MPLKITDTDEGRGSFILGEGDLTEADLLPALQQHLTQGPEKFKAYLYTLVDLSAVTKVPGKVKVMRTIAKLCIDSARYNSNSLDALVVKNNFLYNIVDVWQGYLRRSGSIIKVFHDIEDAKSWLRIQIKHRFGVDDLNFV